MTKQYELWDEYQEGKIGSEELASIDDAINSAEAPDEIKDSISSLARSVKRQSSRSVSLIPPEQSVFNYEPKDRLGVMKDRIYLHLGHSTEGMSPKQIYGKYFSSIESDNYKRKKE